MQSVRQSFGVAHEAGRAWIFAYADKNTLTGSPWTCNRPRLHLVEQLLVDAVRGSAQRKFAQGRQVCRGKEMLQRALGLFGNVYLAFLQALDQVFRRQVHQFDLISAVEHRIRHGFAHAHMRDLRDDVVEAFDMLDVDGGVDVDPGASNSSTSR